MKFRDVVATLLLLFGPAVLGAVSRPVGIVAALFAVAALVYLVLRNERTR